MRRGTIGLFGDEAPTMLPTFRYGCQYSPPMLPLLFNQLQQLDFNIPAALRNSEYQLFHGDRIEGGRGEILLPANAVAH